MQERVSREPGMARNGNPTQGSDASDAVLDTPPLQIRSYLIRSILSVPDRAYAGFCHPATVRLESYKPSETFRIP